MGESSKAAASPAYTMIFDQSAHLDWDWIRTFAQNYWYYTNGMGINDIIAAGIRNAQAATDHSYYYTVCEMGFLRRFIEEHPDQITAIQALGNNFQAISGGVTSPDCQVCSGEGFVRNYIIGQTWLKSTLKINPKPHCWLPDDFGHGPELPALIAALGFQSVAFGRVPGTDSFQNPKLPDDLTANGLDFHWQASDGSNIFAHWLKPRYGIGDELNNGPTAINDFVNYYGPTSTSPPTYTAAKTPWMFIPIDDDFSMPVQNLAADITAWNTDKVSPGGATATNVAVKQGTFDEFVGKVLQTPSAIETRHYNGTPYWTGYFASRPELKTLHYETTRALVAAEIIGLLTQPNNKSINSMLPTDFWHRLHLAWTDYAPSTHHDYVCGTAPDASYRNDQLPLLRGTAATASSLRAIALNALGGMTSITSNPSLVAANPLGFARQGVAVIDGISAFASTVSWPDGTSTATQQTAEGGMLVYAPVPSFGYAIGNGTASQSVAAIDSVTITPTTDGATSYTISNEYLVATITADADWGLASLKDSKNNGAEVLGQGAGNNVVFYNDNGGLYIFGNESSSAGATMTPITNVKVTSSGPGLGVVVLETGPLRTRVRTEVLMELQDPQGAQVATRFVREYELHAGEPFLRMTTSGAAPSGTSVVTAFQLAQPVNTITHGTPYHWTDTQPMDGFWSPPVFRATHDFVLPCDAKANTLAAVYHGGMPAWAIDANGAVIGCMLRNTPADDHHGASGSDPARHTQRYAIRVPSGLGAPTTGQPLREAQGFHTPLQAQRLPDGSQYPGMLTARSASLASVPDDSAAVLTVAKPGSYDPTELVLRLYQPTNAKLEVPVTLPSTPSSAKLVTASETVWTGCGAVATASNAVNVTMEGALATVAIPSMGC